MGDHDIMDMIDIGTGPITLDVQMAKTLGWSREDIEHANKMINTLVRGVFVGVKIRIGWCCEYCGKTRGDNPDCSCMPKKALSDLAEMSRGANDEGAAAASVEPAGRNEGLRRIVKQWFFFGAPADPNWTMCGNCGGIIPTQATICGGCHSTLTVPIGKPFCPACMGTGFEEADEYEGRRTCRRCGGVGHTQKPEET